VDGKTKKPLIKWTEYQTRKASISEIKTWLSKFPTMDIAIVTGKVSGIIVIDVEKGGDISELPPTVIAKTGGGGWHYYYKYPKEKIGNKVRIKELTDVRSDNGYVIAPPSSHKSGNYYTWSLSPSIQEFEELPSKFFEDLKSDKYTKKNWKEIMKVDVNEGGRNDKATQIAGKLLNEVKNKEFAWELLNNWNQAKCNPPLDNQELLSVWNSIVQIDSSRIQREEKERKVEIDKKTEYLRSYKGEDEVVPAIQIYDDEIKSNKNKVKTLLTRIKGLDEKIIGERDNIHGIQEGDLFIISGLSSAGKTTFTNTLIRNISMTSDCMLISFENSIQSIVRRWNPKNVGESDYLNFYTPKITRYNRLDWIEDRVIEAKKKYKVEAVFLDHLDFVYECKPSENKTIAIENALERLQDIARDNRMFIFLICHIAKIEKEHPTKQDLKWASALHQIPAYVLFVHRESTGEDSHGIITYSDKSIIYLVKNRHTGKLGTIEMKYDTNLKKLVEDKNLSVIKPKRSKEEEIPF